MTPPRPATIRLATRARNVPPPAPPAGIGAWSDDADAIAVWLDATDADVRDIAAMAAQIPEASTVASGAPVFVFASAVCVTSGWRRLFGARPVPVPRSVRCAALLARGYVDIGCSPADIAWGVAPAGR